MEGRASASTVLRRRMDGEGLEAVKETKEGEREALDRPARL